MLVVAARLVRATSAHLPVREVGKDGSGRVAVVSEDLLEQKGGRDQHCASARAQHQTMRVGARDATMADTAKQMLTAEHGKAG